MTPQRFQQVRNLFEAALEREMSDRAAFVAGACQNDHELQEEVGRLLEAHDVTLTLLPAASTKVRTDPASREGRRLGDYEILRELGRGGMGAVYLARRADQTFQKNVAIKILRSEAATSDIVRRFHREREILAQLDHPNIARLLDAGSTEDGLPYFVMEYVEGRSITEYADDQRLPMRERMDLFRQVCDAVEYAHRRNVVHRDLKPGNVLVTAAGQVKLLDFGIARLVERAEAEAGGTALTQTGMWLMTPEYASPEQVRGEVAGRPSDVYSLGVILFELLTGHRPYHLRSRIFHEIVRVVCEEPPTRPSTVITQPVEATTADGWPTTLPPETAGRLRQTSLDELKLQLSGDLDNIVLKALQKQPEDRYASPMQLRADIDRHISGEGVWASSDSFMYRMGRVLSRYAVALVGFAAALAAIATGAVKVSWSVLGWVAGAAALIAVWRAATDRQLGKRTQRIANINSLNAVGFLFLLALVLWLRLDWRLSLVAFYSVAATIVFLSLAVWMTRARRSGPLILDISDTSGLIQRRIGLALSLLGCVLSIWTILSGNSFVTTFPVLGLIWMGGMAFIRGCQEIRRDGFVKGGRLIRWSRIASWTWAGTTGTEGRNRGELLHGIVDADRKVLVFHLHRRIQFLPPVRIPIPPSQRDQVEAILRRQLGEWPLQS